jgi:hypothetical protein
MKTFKQNEDVQGMVASKQVFCEDCSASYEDGGCGLRYEAKEVDGKWIPAETCPGPCGAGWVNLPFKK